MACQFKVQPVGIAKVPELSFNNWFFTASDNCAANGLNENMFWNPSLLHSAWACLSQIYSTQTFIKLSIQAFSFILKMKSGGVFTLWIVADSEFYPWKWSWEEAFVHLLWLTIQLSDVFFHSLKNEPHTLTFLRNTFWWDYVKTTRPRLVENDGFCGCITSFDFSWNFKTYWEMQIP